MTDGVVESFVSAQGGHMGANPAPAVDLSSIDIQKRLIDRYDERIAYYWKASRYNKRWYKTTRLLIIVLGALVTLISSLSSAKFVTGAVAVGFAVLTPVFAALLAMVAGLSQAFQWGAAWSDMVITATRLEKERDRVAVTAPAQLAAVKEMAVLDDLVLSETEGFFQRLFGSAATAKPDSSSGG
jgi:hypothetical protein